MMRRSLGVLFMLVMSLPISLNAQLSESPIKIFGYFQNNFQHQTASAQDPEQNSFSLQQLNLFFQKDLAKNWRAFINFEFLNNFSSSRQWGSVNLEEAWVRYRLNEKFNLKMGLLLPIFNHLNEIKNRTPLLPYIIRPLVYETSFEEVVAIDDYTPSRAFLQAYGFLPMENVKFDYAIYLGNSPNISTRLPQLDTEMQTGIDTTDTFLVGGRIGVRVSELKFGFSATRENDNRFQGSEVAFGGAPKRFLEIPRTRFGADLSYHSDKIVFESEIIRFNLEDASDDLDLERTFYYGTLGYFFKENFFIYGSYWKAKENLQAIANIEIQQRAEIDIPTFGVAYNISERVTLKGQYAFVDIEHKDSIRLEDGTILIESERSKINFFAIAASVFF